jgi:glutathione peroxidase
MKTFPRMITTLALAALLAAPIAVTEEPAVKSPLDFTVKTIDGADKPLTDYKGSVVMIVNVASKCGLTPQYEKLQALHDKYSEKGLKILGFPANNFMGQEPGTNEEIKFFCSSKYNVEFDMFSKISVKGDDIDPLYAFLTGEDTNAGFAGDIGWNFEKFLIGRDGKVAARFNPRTAPDDTKVIEAIESALEAAAAEAPATEQ